MHIDLCSWRGVAELHHSIKAITLSHRKGIDLDSERCEVLCEVYWEVVQETLT